MNCGSSYNEESGILGEIFTGIFKKGEQKAASQTETLKGLMALQAARQEAATKKYALEQENRIKTIKIIAIVFGVIIVAVAIVIAAIQLKKQKAVK